MDRLPAADAAKKFGYTLNAFHSLVRDFRKLLKDKDASLVDEYFTQPEIGRKPKEGGGEIKARIIKLRKRYLSVPDITSTIIAAGYDVSEKYVYNIIHDDGFARLPRRSFEDKSKAVSQAKMDAPKSEELDFSQATTDQKFTSENSLGVMCLLPYLQQYGIDKIIKNSTYPQTKSMSRLCSILSFLALKLSDVRRYTADDAWCMDRGLGLFAGLNVLPKAAWFSSYSHRVTHKMNRDFLKGVNKVLAEAGLLSDTANLDFTTIPYWGDDSHLENNWSGKRGRALSSMLAVLASDPDSGVITYADTTIRHENESDAVLEFLDFYKTSGDSNLRYLVFDSKFTTYENLARLDPDVKFLTIRRRGKTIVEDLENLPKGEWKKVRVQASDGKGRTLKVNDTMVFLNNYGKQIRQIAITGHGKIKPALLITNDLDKPCEDLIRKYARRWLVEKEISQQIEFFYLNKVSSSMVIKVDFDFVMSVTAHNLLRLLALDLPGYSHCTATTMYDKFLRNSGSVQMDNKQVTVRLKKKRNLPALLDVMDKFQNMEITMLGKRRLKIEGETRS
ncbi:MAG: transposase [Proteobacteria bacterium]|nr:transposase [Pseudomonadota bacterium]